MMCSAELIATMREAWLRGCKTGRYPKPVKLGPHTTAWKAEDIAALVATFAGLASIHHYLFADIYNFAGNCAR